MTDQERKILRSYLTECLEPQLQLAREFAAKYERDRLVAKDGTAADHAVYMREICKGKAFVIELAISDFRELFEEDLKEGE